MDLLGHPAFKGVSTAGQLILKTAAEKVEFKTGQALNVANAIPNRVLLITSGRARNRESEWKGSHTCAPGRILNNWTGLNIADRGLRRSIRFYSS